jgi:hypothetical protein
VLYGPEAGSPRRHNAVGARARLELERRRKAAGRVVLLTVRVQQRVRMRKQVVLDKDLQRQQVRQQGKRGIDEGRQCVAELLVGRFVVLERGKKKKPGSAKKRGPPSSPASRRGETGEKKGTNLCGARKVCFGLLQRCILARRPFLLLL